MEFEITPDIAQEYELSKKLVKPGRYLAEIADVQDKNFQSGPGMLVRLKGLDGDAAGVPFFCVVLPSFPPLFLGFIEALGTKIDPRAGKNAKGSINNSTVKGMKVGIRTKQDEYEGELQNKIIGFYHSSKHGAEKK